LHSILPSDYSETLLEIKNRINLTGYKSLEAVNSEQILMNLDIGRTISIKVANGWGDAIVDNMYFDIQSEFPGIKGFPLRYLRRIKFIYE
jgi:hypothetical protein